MFYQVIPDKRRLYRRLGTVPSFKEGHGFRDSWTIHVRGERPRPTCFTRLIRATAQRRSSVTGLNTTGYTGFADSTGADSLYVALGFPGTSILSLIDTDTGAATLIGPTGLEIEGMVYEDGSLWAVTLDDNICTVDQTTGTPRSSPQQPSRVRSHLIPWNRPSRRPNRHRYCSSRPDLQVS